MSWQRDWHPASSPAHADDSASRTRPPSARAPLPALAEPHGARVGLWIDWCELSDCLADSSEEPGLLPARLRGLAEEHGCLLRATAYGEWHDRERATEFRRHQIEPCWVATADGRGASALRLALDGFESLWSDPGLDVYVLAVGSSEHRALIPRLRAAGRRVVLVAPELNCGRESLAASDRFVALEMLLEARHTEAAVAPQPDLQHYDWRGLVLTVRELEQQMPFLGFGWLLKKRLNRAACGFDSIEHKQRLLDHAVDEGILVLYKVPNIDGKLDPVTACKLNPEHPKVRALLEQTESERPS